jgi:hypothetical protein
MGRTTHARRFRARVLLMTTVVRFARDRLQAWLTCAVWLVGCNGLLDIHQPAKQLLQSDGGAITLRDSGMRELVDAGAPPVDRPIDTKPVTTSPTTPPDNHPTAAKDAGASPVPDAGSGTSPYVWANWPMPNPQATGLPNAQGYATLAAGRVADKVTHLEWQQWSDDKQRSWSDAVAYCAGLTLGDNGGWRLPSRIELLSLLDFASTSPAAIDAQAFAGAPPSGFWSASLYIGARSIAWGVNFGFQDGIVFTDDMSKTHYVRCVR